MISTSIATAALILSGAWWLLQAAGLARSMRAVPLVPRLSPEPLTAWPRVSLVIPARDEGRHLGAALRSRLADGYPDIEAVLVNDRSTDDTGERRMVEVLLRRMHHREPRHHPPGAGVGGDGEGDHLGEPQPMEREVEGGAGGLRGVAAAPVLAG